MHKKHIFTPRSYCLTATMLLSSYFLLTYTRSLHCAILGKIIGTIPEECAADAISMVKARNEEIEEREKEKENQKANLYIPSTIGTQMNPVPFCLCYVKNLLKICAILLKYSTFEGVFL